VELNQQRPRRRSTTHVETIHGELCIYEWTTKTVHALNPAAARVWETCDGRTSVDAMIAAVRGDFGAAGAEAIVEHALSQFAGAGLLEPGTDVAPGLSRRALLRCIGTAAAIPIVTSIAAPAPLAAQSGVNTRTFNFTGAPQSFMVPAGVTALQVDVIGGSGAGTAFPPPTASPFPGASGRVQATLPVTPAEILTIMVGAQGDLGGAAVFNGGGAAGADGVYGGGGASDIRRGTTRVIVAGGGGGGGQGTGPGGSGGGLIGGTGSGNCGGGGAGGTQAAGGVGGVGSPSGSPGTSGTGGKGGDSGVPGTGGAGGGGGYFGGGGGGACPSGAAGVGAGGGGSSFTDPSATGVVHTQGYQPVGPGSITLRW